MATSDETVIKAGMVDLNIGPSVYPDELLLLGNWNNVIRHQSPNGVGDVISVVLGKGRLKGDGSKKADIYFGTPEMYPSVLRLPEASPHVNLSAKQIGGGDLEKPVLCLGFEILLKKISAGTYQGTGAFTLAYNFDGHVTPEYNRSILDFNPLLNTNPVYLSARMFKGKGLDHLDHTLEIAVKSYDNEKASDIETIVVFSYTYNISSAFRRPIAEGGIFGTLEVLDPDRSQLFDNSIVSDIQIVPKVWVDTVWLDTGLGITTAPIWGANRRNVYFDEFAFSNPYDISDIIFFDIKQPSLKYTFKDSMGTTAISTFTSDPNVVRFYSRSNTEMSSEPSDQIIEKEEKIDIIVRWQLSWMPSYEALVEYPIFKEGRKIGIGRGNRFVVKFPNDHSLPSSVDKLLTPLNAQEFNQILWTYKTKKLNRSSDGILSNEILNVKGVFIGPTEQYKVTAAFNIPDNDAIKTMFFEVESALKKIWPKHVIDNIELKQDEGLYIEETGRPRPPPPIEDYPSFGPDVPPKTQIRMILFNTFNNIESTYAFWQPSSAQVRDLTGRSKNLEYKYLEVMGAYIFDKSNTVNKEKAIGSASLLLQVGAGEQTTEIKNLINGASSLETWDLPQVLFGKFEPGPQGSEIGYIEPWSTRYKAYGFNTGVDFIFKAGKVSELFSAVPNQVA